MFGHGRDPPPKKKKKSVRERGGGEEGKKEEKRKVNMEKEKRSHDYGIFCCFNNT